MTSRAFASHFRARVLYSPNISSDNCGISERTVFSNLMKRISRVGESFGTGKVKNVKVEKLDSVDKKIGGYTNVVQKMKLFMKRILKNGKEDSKV
ncbi:hypothetical protein B9Z55_002996 [Caenorhabditis nigoni]|uniref:Uncharacterized protein n=1 Tax=Caenorhabditis nigoni TaxID=1611254 RepID=A0A2G5VNL7_9PELO|nr:hypothetical protein B9Z55_002996 [Caenorhabditis nigoni]